MAVDSTRSVEPIDLSVLARQAMLDRGLEPDFPTAAVDQAERLNGPAQDREIADQTDVPWFSIDNDESRDLDQLTFAERIGRAAVRIRVAVADVDALVPKGTALDDHARQNTTSVYTPTKVFSMLPERLSTDLTSLNPGEDRVAVIISYTVSTDGDVDAGEVGRARVRNRAKLTYNNVDSWLAGNRTVPQSVAGLMDQIRTQYEASQRLNQRRHEEGALDLETIEPRVTAVNGRVVDMRHENKNRARSLIEDIMIAANGVTARYLEAKGLPSVRRVVRSPARWDRLKALAAELRDSLPSDPDPKALAEFLTRRRQEDPVRFPDLSLSVVKLLGRGEYVLTRSHEEEAGHFGLAVSDYVHSTAPNRRYPDLITHRLVKAAMAGKPSPYSGEELEELARHCTKQENAADKVERRMRKSAAALLLSSRIGQRFQGIVTGAAAKGTWVRIFDPPTEGRLVRGAAGLDVGDRLRVRLAGTNVERGFIDFERTDSKP